MIYVCVCIYTQWNGKKCDTDIIKCNMHSDLFFYLIFRLDIKTTVHKGYIYIYIYIYI